MIIENRWFPVLFMFLATFFFSSLIIGFARFTSARVEANQTLAFERAVLSVLPDLSDTVSSRTDLHRTFAEKIILPDFSTAGAYTVRENGKIIHYILPVSGQGFWAPIKGVIGIQEDRKTLTGVAFYEQNETPGLGAEIAKEPFREQFVGVIIATGDRPIGFKRPSETLNKNEVHAVTGATQTSTRLEKIINSALSQWQQAMDAESNTLKE
jgi:Na+-transporting NADH:ubiquinone oxidoreductase subunit C